MKWLRSSETYQKLAVRHDSRARRLRGKGHPRIAGFHKRIAAHYRRMARRAALHQRGR